MRHVRPLSFLLACFMVFSLFGCAKKAETAVLTWEQQYELGLHYLSEGNYKEAIIAFTSAIEIDPKRVETYRALADVYVEMGDAENARATLESGYAATEDESLLDYLDSLDTPEGPADGVTPFESRLEYRDFSTLTAEQTAFLNNMITALEAEDQDTLVAMAPDFPVLFEQMDYFGSPHLMTKTDEYKISVYAYSLDIHGKLVMCIRPKNGTGYFAEVQPKEWVGSGYATHRLWDYAVVDCVNWYADGSFRRNTLRYISPPDSDNRMYTSTEIGTAAAGVMQTNIWTSSTTNLITGEVSEDTVELTYENGHEIWDGGIAEHPTTPFGGRVDSEWIFW